MQTKSSKLIWYSLSLVLMIIFIEPGGIFFLQAYPGDEASEQQIARVELKQQGLGEEQHR